MILSADAIKNAIDKGYLLIEPFDEKNLKLASYIFTLSSKIMVSRNTSCVNKRRRD